MAQIENRDALEDKYQQILYENGVSGKEIYGLLKININRYCTKTVFSF